MIKKINFYNWRIMLMGIERIAEFEKLEKEDYIKAFLEKREKSYFLF